jgi:hypothetical protein
MNDNAQVRNAFYEATFTAIKVAYMIMKPGKPHIVTEVSSLSQ